MGRQRAVQFATPVIANDSGIGAQLARLEVVLVPVLLQVQVLVLALVRTFITGGTGGCDTF